MQPSSPNRPCSAMNATSTPELRTPASQSPVMSTSRTLYPRRRRAATAAAPVRSDTSLSEDSPPRNTPTVFSRYFPFSGIGDPPQLHFEGQIDPRHHPYPFPGPFDEAQRVR